MVANEIAFTIRPWNCRHFESMESLYEVCFILYGLHHFWWCQVSGSHNTNVSSILT